MTKLIAMLSRLLTIAALAIILAFLLFGTAAYFSPSVNVVFEKSIEQVSRIVKYDLLSFSTIRSKDEEIEVLEGRAKTLDRRINDLIGVHEKEKNDLLRIHDKALNDSRRKIETLEKETLSLEKDISQKLDQLMENRKVIVDLKSDIERLEKKCQDMKPDPCPCPPPSPPPPQPINPDPIGG